MLQGMERYAGVFICTTNLFQELDEAALRRFTFKIQFCCSRRHAARAHVRGRGAGRRRRALNDEQRSACARWDCWRQATSRPSSARSTCWAKPSGAGRVSRPARGRAPHQAGVRQRRGIGSCSKPIQLPERDAPHAARSASASSAGSPAGR